MMNLICCILGGGVSAVVGYCSGIFDSVGKIWLFPVLWLLFYVAFVALTFCVLFLVSFVLKKQPPEKPNKFALFIVKYVTDFICQMSNLKIHMKNGDLLKKGPNYLIVFNHRSKYDNLIILNKFGRVNPVMISKPENLKIPLAGPFINRAGFLAIDRENDREALKTIVKASKFLKNENVSVCICPEGTRNRTGRDLLPFKVGALKVGTRVSAPIAVITFEGTQNVHKNAPFKKTHVYLDVLKVYQPEEYKNKNTHELGEEIRAVMQANIDAYSQRIDQCEKMSA